MPNDVTVDLGNAYIGSAYSPQVAITETETGHEIDFTFADSEHPGQTKTEGFEVPNYANEEAEREAAEAARAAAESARAAAEEGRMNRELDRVFNENARINAEELREDAETARASAEQARAAAETARASAEGSRASAEQARTSAESARASAESGRATAESARVSAEQARATAESARAAAESARVTAEQARQANTTAAIARADAATAAANTATTNAQTATTAAQAATGEAGTATDAANAAAALATAAAETVTDAYSPMFTAGAAEGITGGGPADTAAWTYRACPGTDGPATIESIHGRTVAWNQGGRFVKWSGEAPKWGSGFNSWSISADGRSASIENGAGTNIIYWSRVPTGHKVYFSIYITASGTFSNNVKIGFGGTIASSGVTLQPNTKARVAMIGTMGTANTSVGIYPDGTSSSVTCDYTLEDFQLFDLTAMFGAGNEPSTVAEFEALYPEPYYPYDAGSLLSVQMEGIETVGFNQWDEEWEVGGYLVSNGTTWGTTDRIRSKSDHYIPVFPDTEYSMTRPSGGNVTLCYYDANKQFISGGYISSQTFTTPANAHYLRFAMYTGYGTTYNHDICINLSGPRNGEYEPYWQSERTIPATDLCSAGTVYDELTATERITRVGEVDLGTLTWAYDSNNQYFTCTNLTTRAPGFSTLKCSKYETASSASTAALTDKQIVGGNSSVTLYVKDTAYTDAATFKASLDGVMLHYALATPTTQPIDPPLNLIYKAAAGGTERIVHTDPTAAPTLVVTYGSTADGIRDRALGCIARIENGLASANYGVGSYLIHGGTLCRVTTAIAAGEAITIGTNVTATTVMAELLTLTQ